MINYAASRAYVNIVAYIRRRSFGVGTYGRKLADINIIAYYGTGIDDYTKTVAYIQSVAYTCAWRNKQAVTSLTT